MTEKEIVNNGAVLVIAEKPSVAKSIAKVIGAYRQHDGYIDGSGFVVSWCYGHLVEYAPPDAYDERFKQWSFDDLPIVPGHWKMQVPKDKEKQFCILKQLLSGSYPKDKAGNGECSKDGNCNDASENDLDFLPPITCVVNACDAGREGELIFWNVYKQSGSVLPVKRLWISSMEESAIEDGFARLKDSSCYKGILDAAVCRARADWLVGMNATRAFTTKYGRKLLVGRVQSPTLALIVSRQREIDGFKKEAYFKAVLKGDGIIASSESITDEARADAIVKACESSPAAITKVEKNRRRQNPPKLYDLTSLQRDANRIFGYTAQQTLDAEQGLYEKKLATYPRTDSRFITSDMEQTVSDLLEGLSECFSFAAKSPVKNVQRLICDSKVSDHHAILPTKESLTADISGLSEKEHNIYLLISARLCSAASEPSVTEETKVEITCAGTVFTAKGRKALSEGFLAVENAFMSGHVRKPKAEETDPDISIVNIIDEPFEGMTLVSHSAEKTKHFTAPPKPYTEDTLLSAMENAGRAETDDEVERKGIGTPATRAGTIEKLVRAGYVARRGRKLIPTEEGLSLYDILPEKMKSASLTAAWENWLLAIEKGNSDSGMFMAAIIGDVSDLINGLAKVEAVDFQKSASKSLGKCPKCGNDVIHGRYGAYCRGKCGMSFRVYGREVKDEELSKLLSGEPLHMKDRSKNTGKTYRYLLIPDGTEEYSYLKDGEQMTGCRFKFRRELKTGENNNQKNNLMA